MVIFVGALLLIEHIDQRHHNVASACFYQSINHNIDIALCSRSEISDADCRSQSQIAVCGVWEGVGIGYFCAIVQYCTVNSEETTCICGGEKESCFRPNGKCANMKLKTQKIRAPKRQPKAKARSIQGNKSIYGRSSVSLLEPNGINGIDKIKESSTSKSFSNNGEGRMRSRQAGHSLRAGKGARRKSTKSTKILLGTR